MIIYGQGEKNIIPWEKVEEVSAGDTAVFVELSQRQTRAGTYANKEQCRFAVGMLAAAVRAGEDTFYFPSQREIEVKMDTARQHRSSVTSRKRSHGKS